MSDSKFCFIQFKLTYKTVPGEEIRVVGSIPELGSWNPNSSERLKTSKLDFPLWRTKENIKVNINTQSEIQYKYVIFKNGVFDHWEGLESDLNRSLNLKNLIRVIIHDTQGQSTSKIEKFTKFDSGVSPVSEEEKEDNKFDFREPKIKKFFLTSRENETRFSLLSSIRESLNPQDMCVKEENELPELNWSGEEEELPATEKSIINQVDLTPNDKVIMCSLYLPYVATQNEKGEWDIGTTNEPFYNTLAKLCKNKENIIWIGLLRNFHLIKNEHERDSIITKLKKLNMYVVKLDETSTLRLHKLVTAILEPLFHYIKISHEVEQIKEFESLWKAYKEFNECLSKMVLSHLSESTLIFLHDYHLFLAPSFIYNATQHSGKILKNVSVGLFIHSPFPSHDNFRRFPFREEILKSMMNCSVIGFHTFDSSRNFLTSCRRLLLINSMSILKGDLALSYFGRKVLIRVKHVSSVPEFILNEIKGEIFKSTYNQLKERYKGKYLFVGVDNKVFLPGVRNKLEAYKRFLRDIGDNYEQNVLLQYIDSRPSEEEEFYSTKEEIDTINENMKNILELSQSINKEFGEVVKIVEKKVTYAERLAVLAAGKCLVKSCKKESFSLDVHEFLNLKIILNDTAEMGYILSELSGVSSSLSGAIRVNPFDIRSIQSGFQTAFQVHFDKEGLSESQEKDLIHVKKNTADLWLNSFLKELKNAFDIDNDTYYLGAGIGLNFRLMKISSNFKELDKGALIRDYDKSRRRLILLDYEGTLPTTSQSLVEYQSKGLSPSPKILNVLDHLTKDKRNTIFIVTGREAKLVSEWFSSVPDLGLASEHGFLYRYSTYSKAKDNWEKMLKGFNGDWRGYCVEQLEPYTERCEGSFIEVKEASVVWQYRDCDPELGKSFAQVMTDDFENSFKNLKLQVVNGKGYVEVKPEGINKGTFASFIFKKEVLRKRCPDFILAIGDDTADEEMFKFFDQKINTIKHFSKKVKVYTVTVGKKPSSAASYVDSTADVRTILEAFMQISNRKTISSSSADLRSLNLFGESSTTISNEKTHLIVDEVGSDKEI